MPLDNPESRLTKAISILEKAVVIGQNGLLKHKLEYYPPTEFVLLNYLERFTYSLLSVKLLLPEFIKFSSVETSIGLILRTTLLDFMTLCYFAALQSNINDEESASDKKVLEDELNSFLTDNVYNSLQYLTGLKQRNIISDNEYRKNVTILHEHFNFLFKDEPLNFDNPKKSLLSQKFKNPRQLFEFIHEHQLTKKYSVVYELYSIYSKYEHLGIMTNGIQNLSLDITIKRIIISLKFVVIGLNTTLLALLNEEHEGSSEFVELEKLTDQLIQLT